MGAVEVVDGGRLSHQFLVIGLQFNKNYDKSNNLS
jgi:hypothetical protein